MNYKEEQAKTREALKPKDISADYPNSRPQHMIRTKNGFEPINRTRARSTIGFNDSATTKKRKQPFQHIKGTGYTPDLNKLENRPDLTNKQKNALRRAQREIKLENERKAKELQKLREEK